MICKVCIVIIEKVALNKRDNSNWMDERHRLHLAAVLVSAGRMWFESHQILIRICAVFSPICEELNVAVSVSDVLASQRVTGMVMGLTINKMNGCHG